MNQYLRMLQWYHPATVPSCFEKIAWLLAMCKQNSRGTTNFQDKILFTDKYLTNQDMVLDVDVINFSANSTTKMEVLVYVCS